MKNRSLCYFSNSTYLALFIYVSSTVIRQNRNAYFLYIYIYIEVITGTLRPTKVHRARRINKDSQSKPHSKHERRELKKKKKMREWTTSDVNEKKILIKRFGQRPSSVIYLYIYIIVKIWRGFLCLTSSCAWFCFVFQISEVVMHWVGPTPSSVMYLTPVRSFFYFWLST